jgi:nanoRNase/pAp phosphatase (c-di-AMP/oligoRNAs hydrolase)
VTDRTKAVPSSGSKVGVLFVSDQPGRLQALRQSALAGREVFLWTGDHHRVPNWSVPLRGDPAKSETFAPLEGRDAIAVIDLADETRARRVARAVRGAFPPASILVIDHWRKAHHGPARDGLRWLDEGELLADAIELVLRRVASHKRLRGLRRALRGRRTCAFLVQNDPDPDAIASALALRRALGMRPERSPIITLGYVTRPENRRLIEELGVVVAHVTRRELAASAPLVLVDVQPPYFTVPLPEVAAVVDHHPTTGAYRSGFRDVRTWFGASATMAAEYLLASDEQEIATPLATALLYGIVTDTKSLSRSASDDDLQMFAYLFPRADQAMLRRIQHPSYGTLALKRFGDALQRPRVHEGLAYVHLGRLPEDQEHIVAQLAEFCLGMAGASVSAVSGVFGTNLVMSTRALSPAARLGERLRAEFKRYGSAGGHPVMAKAVMDLEAWRRVHPFTDSRSLERTVQRALRKALGGSPNGTNPVSSPSAARARR